MWEQHKEFIPLADPLPVLVGSIGSDIHYEMETSTVSLTRFVLSVDNPEKFPFSHSSILEVWLDIGEEEPVFCNGKISTETFESPEGDTPAVVIRIIQIASKQGQRLVHFLAKQSSAAVA